MKGVAFAPRVLILDEPTSSLTIREVRLVKTKQLRGLDNQQISDAITKLGDRFVPLTQQRSSSESRSRNGCKALRVPARTGRLDQQSSK